MAKNRGKKKGISDKVRFKKASNETKINPFEVKINRQKHDVLGKKVAKHDRGMPGVSRFKAIKKRKETLLVEYKNRGKVNKFVDRRFGENDADLSLEDKMLQRFALERQKGHEKSGLFNLNDEEELTHYGQSLSEIEKFEEPDISDDDEDRGILSGDLVTEEHFGGFLTKKKESTSDQPQKSWKERMEEIITKSKKRKFERQSEKEKSSEMTEKLDKDWKELMGAMVSSKRTKDSIEEKTKADDYDMMVRQLQFDVKGKATDRLKTDEEIALEEKEHLEKMEADRIRRMQGISEEEESIQKMVYRSADDLDDGFSVDKKVGFQVSYADGKLISSIGPEEDDEIVATNDAEEGENSDEEDAEDDEDEELPDEEEESDEDALAQSSDLESSEEECSESDSEKNKKVSKPVKGILKINEATKTQAAENLKKRKADKEAAENELPYTFPAPETYEQLLGLLEGHTETDQFIIIERMRRLYHPSLAEGNKDKLHVLYGLLLQYYCDLALQEQPLLVLMDKLVKHLYPMTKLFPDKAAISWVQLLSDQHSEFSQAAKRKGGRTSYPSLDVLLLLKLIPVIFPTSDLKHHVVTPAMLYMGQILSQCSVTSAVDAAKGLFVCGLFLQFVTLSKRIVPEVLNFLHGVLFMAMKKEPGVIYPVQPPFKPVGKYVDILKLRSELGDYVPKCLSVSKVFSSDALTFLDSDEFRACAIHQCLGLTQKFLQLYEKQPSCQELFKPLINHINRLKDNVYPQVTRLLKGSVLNDYKKACDGNPIVVLVQLKDRPKPLQTFEPKFDEHFDGKRKRVGSRETQEKQRLVHKHKKEMKGAVRSLRQDNQFLAREKLHEQMERDAERKRKVKVLFEDLAAQEGDFNTMKRKKESA